MMLPFIIILGLVVLAALWAIGVYNALVSLRNRTEEAWSDIDVQLKRRYDLIPNLVETVKGYATHEKETLEKVTEARTVAMDGHSKNIDAAQQAANENVLSSTLKSIFALSESYPDLKANQNFLHLQGELSDTENKIEASRRFYNANVRDLNTKIEMFPSNLIAGMLGIVRRSFFESIGEERNNVAVKF